MKSFSEFRKSFRKWATKLFYTLKGFFMLLRFKPGRYYASEFLEHRRFLYQKNREFLEAYADSVIPGIVYNEQKKKIFDYWEIAILKLKEN